jgi:hypothetical protein
MGHHGIEIHDILLTIYVQFDSLWILLTWDLEQKTINYQLNADAGVIYQEKNIYQVYLLQM